MTDTRPIPGLIRHHTTHLRDAAIADEIITERKYRSITRDTPSTTESHDLLKRLGIPGIARRNPTCYPGLLIPLYRATGELISWQYRPDRPPKDPKTGRLRKYLARVGHASTVDVHPRNRNRIIDPTVALWITEGVKKGDALTTAGACVATLSGVYNWRSRLGTLGDWEDIALRGREVIVCFDADAHTNPAVARAMGRLGRWLKSKGADTVRYLITPAEINGVATKGADDYLAAGGTLTGLLAAATLKPPRIEALSSEFTDAILAEVIADEVMGERFIYTDTLGWMEYDGRRWAECPDVAVHEAVRDYYAEWYARELTAGDLNTSRAKGLFSLLGRSRISATTDLARGIVLRDAADFDQHPDFLNTPTGVVDLTTRELLPHDPNLLATKITTVGYKPGAVHADWAAALTALPAEILPWYQMRLGQGITGHMTSDDILLITVGCGENGKSTINGTLQETLGDYCTLVSDRILLGDATMHPTELMDLRGVRVAIAEETPEARQLSITRLKKVIGTPKISARRVHQDSVVFPATHTLLISTNYRPVVAETDHGTWRRLQLLTFPYRFRKPHEPLVEDTDRRGDPNLRARLQKGRSAQEAALAWLIEGAHRWYRDDRTICEAPESVKADTRAWRCDSDLVMAYLDERLEAAPGRYVISTELLEDFNSWLLARGHKPWSEKTMITRFGEHEILTGWRVYRDRITDASGVSRPGEKWLGFVGSAVPARFHAWVGMKFTFEKPPPR